MKFLNDTFFELAEYKKLLDYAQKGELPLAASGLAEIHKACLISALYEHTKKKILVITPDEASAALLCDDMRSLGNKSAVLPVRDYNLARLTGFSKEYEHKRIDTLSGILDGAFDVVISSVDASLLYTMPPEVLKQRQIKLCTGESADLEELVRGLTAAGYKRCEICEGAGQFSLRGGILDVFPVGNEYPIRAEFWGDEIDTLSEFDVLTQRRTQTVKSFIINPANEHFYDKDSLTQKLTHYLKSAKRLTDKQRASIESDLMSLESDLSISPDLYIPILYEKAATVFDYTNDFSLVVCETGKIEERLKSIAKQQSEDIKNLLEEGLLSKQTSNIYLTSDELFSHFDKAVFLESFPKASYKSALKGLLSFDFKRLTPWNGDIEILKEDISHITRLKGLAVILAGEEKAGRLLCDDLNASNIKATFAKDTEDVGKSGVFVTVGGLSGGIEIPEKNVAVITHRFIASEGRKKTKTPKNAKSIGSLDELKLGDTVVHASHGIGIFDGINRITAQGVTKDYIKIKFAPPDILYVPVTQLDLVSKYIGAAEGVKLNKLGTDTWQKTRSRVKAAVKNMAKELTALYAKRMSAKGYAFSPDTDLQSEFELRFEYEETDDQLRSIREIKQDMEKGIPMDRLLCGDVGFGKTEVALRAAFKCVSEGKQCALLVPTTILSMQHFTTVTRRFGELPVTVKLLNRFVSKKETEGIIKGLKSGSVDMVIGTHRLISKDVSFKDLGLVIIDEEQRFGVAQKERLKELYPHVDILTLSATPIPRTLNMAMSGLRDMSTIDEAPSDRYPVQTYVLEQNTGLLTDAINKELRRGGQVYYLHNRVDSIDLCAAKLKERIPDARIGIAHGKMSEDELSDVWQLLIDHEIDILVCTTIIETGVDVPNANTLIIENADRMGLAQLHQLRGRVGRSPRRAYAYFCYNPNKIISEDAVKRLEAIREFTQFGSGFKIALRDLEIRGAGSILGGEQHGNMEAVGYDMYLKLLSDAVNEENGIKVQEEINCTVDLNISAHIPERYIPSLSARLGIYKRIADVKTDDDETDVIDELCDRFGEPPKEVLGLINVALLRNKAYTAGITEITGTENTVILHTDSYMEETAAKLMDNFKNALILATDGKPKYTVKLKPKQKHSDIVEILKSIL